MRIPRGYQYNNPFDLMWNADITWHGQVSHQPGLLMFDTVINGIRAGIIDARTKVYKDHLDTIETFIEKFAPPKQNNTVAYIKFMYGQLHYAPGQKIELETNEQCIAWAGAITRQEMGVKFMPKYVDIVDGVKEALNHG